jgi:hypothetical protein
MSTLAPSPTRPRRGAAEAIDANDGRYGRHIVAEARRARLPLPLACALVEQESSFRNVYGHDAVRNPVVKGSRVTRENYLQYRAWRDAGRGAQGVGVTQLTWPPYQDRADRLGGCWSVRNQLRVGFEVLADHIARHGVRGGLAVYNAGKPNSAAGLAYAARVLEREQRWKRVLKERPQPASAPGRPRTLRRGLHGRDVALLQRTLNRYYKRWGAPQLLDVDGDFGAETELAFRRARLRLGLAAAMDQRGRVLVSPGDRVKLRNPARRTAAERERAKATGRAYEKRLIERFRRERKRGAGRPKVVRLQLAFDTSRLARNTAVHTTVGHHSAGPVDRSDREAIELCKRWHAMHRNERGWAGIGYHVCIARSGTIILLRPGWAKGAGVEGHNTGTFHVMFNGDFRSDRPSPEQIASYRWFMAHGHEIDGIPRQGARRLGHKDFPGHESNECPGTHLHPIVKGS